MIAFAPDQPQARLGAPLPPWEQAAMEARRPSLTHQQQTARPVAPRRAPSPALAGPPAPAGRATRGVRPPRAALPEVSLSALTPLRLLWSHLLTVRGLSAWFLVFATAPFVLLQVTADDPDFSHAAWGFAIYFAMMWGLAIHLLVRPEPVSRWLVVKVVGTVAVLGTALAVALERALSPDLDHVLWAIFGVGVPEEVAKALPVVLFMLLAKPSWTTRMYLFMGAVSGLTFGVIEAVGYSSLYQLVGGGSGTATTLIIWRLLADGLFHGCCAAVSAYFIGLAWWRPDQRWQLVGVGVAIAAVLHGVYDRWSGGWVGTATAVLIVLLFVGYVRAGDAIVQDLAVGPVAELPHGELPPAELPPAELPLAELPLADLPAAELPAREGSPGAHRSF
ncbi:hypothetical protein GCM10023145_02330 [Angustibacter luteus]